MPPKRSAAPAAAPSPLPEPEEPPAAPEPTAEELAAAEEAARAEAEEKPPREPLRGSLGHVYEDVFQHLYQDHRSPGPAREDGSPDPAAGDGDGAELDETQLHHAAPPHTEAGPDFSEEDAEIARIQKHLGLEQERLGSLVEDLKQKHSDAAALDKAEEDYLQQNWGLARHDLPVNESKLRTLLDRHRLDTEGLHVPRAMMEDVEREIAIKTGSIEQHENMYAISKPTEPNYLASTASYKIRYQVRNVQATLTQAQKSLLSGTLAERTAKIPPKAKTLSMEGQDKNREIIKRMQSKVSFLVNPRFSMAGANEGTCPFFMSPDSVVFRDYEVGGVYEVMVELRNTTGVGRRLRVLPCNHPAFSISSLQYGGSGGGQQPSSIVSPGMAARLAVRFAPSDLDNISCELTVVTEFGDFKLPLLARRVQPRLTFTNPVDCGCLLAGETIERVARVTNRGGEGSFRLIAADPETECVYETTDDGETTLVSRGFRVTPACFYLDATESADIFIRFTTPDVAYHCCKLEVECDNRERTPLKLEAITDALRLELTRWPTRSEPVGPPPSIEPGVSPWSVVPWQLNWLTPGTQVGSQASQEITISNGGNLPAHVHWRFASVPKAMLSWLAVGGRQRLTEAIVAGIHTWGTFREDVHGTEECPFEVSPSTTTIQPFQSVTFSFTFRAHAPVGRRATTFAYLVATDLPVHGHCLLHLERLLQLQKTMAPKDCPQGYIPGLPLFGGAAEGGVLFDESPAQPTDPGQPEMEVRDRRCSCTITAICLQGLSVAPTVSCVPHVIALAGDTLPYLAHRREFVLRNTGRSPSYFRVRTTSRKRPEEFSSEEYDALWIVSRAEVGAGPEAPPTAEQMVAERLDIGLAAERLRSLWPPLPPSGCTMAMQPGFGALATIVVEPDEGQVPAGGSVSVRVTLRATREMDLEGSFLIDLPVGPSNLAVTPPLKVSLLAAVRSPRVEVRNTGFLDYGVVRAHAMHSQKLQVDNPSDLPMLVRLQQGHHDETAKGAGSLEASPARFLGLRNPREANVGGASLRTPRTPRLLTTPRLPAPTKLTPRRELDPRATSPPRRKKPSSALSFTGEEDPGPTPAFLMNSHMEVVDFFTNAVLLHQQYEGPADLCAKERRLPEVKPWVNARSGCVDASGRRPYKRHKGSGPRGPQLTNVVEERSEAGTEPDLVFKPACFVLWPRSSAEVEVEYRADTPTKFRGFVEATSFDSMFPQCVQVLAEVQLPRLRLSSQHVHFPVAYSRILSSPVDLRLYNKSDMTATFSMLVPLKMEAGIEVQIEPRDGTVEPRGEATLQVFVIPTRKGEVAEQTVQVCVGDIIQPLALKVSANVFGVEVDYAIIPVGEPFPIIENAPRKPDDPPNVGTHQVLQGRAPRNAPTIDFGEMPLLSSKSMQVVLYNRSGIPAPYAVSVAKNPAYVPNLKGRKIGGLLEAATKMYCLRPQAGTDDGATSFGPETFANEPMPAASGKAPDGATTGGRKDSRRSSTASHQRGSRTSTRAVARKNSHLKSRRSADGGNSTQKTTASRRFLLDDKHEAQAFRSSFGGEFAKQKEQHQQYTIALKEGRGWAVRVEPSSDWLQPFLYSVITLTCYSDLPGVMEDELIVKIPHLAGHEEGNAFRIPMKLVSVGNPLSLPEEQVGLCATEDPPRLLCGTIVPSEMRATRRFKVANSSAAPMKITWKVYPKVQLESMKSERQFLNIALCRKGDTDPFEDTVDVFRPSFDDDPALDAAEGLQEEEDRPYQFNLWAGEPPTVTDPLALQSTDDMPMRVEPEQGVVPIHGTATFTVTLTASKAMPTAAGHYHYVLVGKGRFTEERETYLAQLGASSSEPSRFLEPVQPVPKVKEEVGDLPRLRLDEDELLDSDSDQEGLPPPRTRPDSEQSNAPRPAAPLSEPQVAVAADTTTRLPGEPDKDVLSTIVIDCIGDCIVPRLTIDKKAHPGVKEFQAHGSDSDGEKEPMNCPVFKFIHSTVMPVHLDGPAPRSQQPLGTQGAPPGTPFDAVATQYPQQLDVHGPALRNQPLGMTLGAPLGSSPCDGVVSHLMREVSMTNSNACVVTCRFRVQGPFQIREITQVGRHPVRKPTQSKMRTKRVRHQEDPQEQPPTELFKVGKLETITLQIEFAPDLVPASWWTDHKPEHHFPGDLIIEYPSDITKDIDDARMDLQRVHLVAISRRPALKVALLPNSLDAPKSERPELVQQPTWFGKPAVLVEFGHVHVESSISRTRTIFITNETNVVAYWRIMHVGRKRRGPHDTNVPPDDEEFRALDDKDCFHFDVNQGTLLGPSKGAIPIDPKGERYRPRGTPERIPYLMPEMGPLHTKYQPKTEEHRYEPQRIRIDFKPVKNELYKSRFRVQVEKGLSVDFICRGCGSYDEEDDAIDMPMAQ